MACFSVPVIVPELVTLINCPVIPFSMPWSRTRALFPEILPPSITAISRADWMGSFRLTAFLATFRNPVPVTVSLPSVMLTALVWVSLMVWSAREGAASRTAVARVVAVE